LTFLSSLQEFAVQNGQVKIASDFHRPMLASLQASRRQDEKHYRLQGKADASEPDNYTSIPAH
jgi:hypothetical protein